MTCLLAVILHLVGASWTAAVVIWPHRETDDEGQRLQYIVVMIGVALTLWPLVLVCEGIGWGIVRWRRRQLRVIKGRNHRRIW